VLEGDVEVKSVLVLQRSNHCGIPHRAWKKEGPPLGIGGPRRRVSIAGVVFTPARGVIHPSFPLRGRWERSV